MPKTRALTDEDRELLKDVTIPANLDACVKLMFTLEADVHEGGWDQDHMLYMVVGDPEDPYFVKHPVGVVRNPAMRLQALWDHGVRFTKDVHALVFASETWRHLIFEEAVTPEILAKLIADMRERFPEITEVEAREHAVNGYYKMVEERLPSPSQMPDTLRKESRNVIFTFRDGTTLGVMRDRDGEPKLMDPMPWELAKEARVPKFIYQMLNDQRPEMAPGENLWEGHV